MQLPHPQDENAQQRPNTRKELLAAWLDKKTTDQLKPVPKARKATGATISKRALSEVTSNGLRMTGGNTLSSFSLKATTTSANAPVFAKTVSAPHKSQIPKSVLKPASGNISTNAQSRAVNNARHVQKTTKSSKSSNTPSSDLLNEIEAIMGKSLISDDENTLINDTPTRPPRPNTSISSSTIPFSTLSKPDRGREEWARQWQQRVTGLEKTLVERDVQYRHAMATQEDEEYKLRNTLSELEFKISKLESKLAESESLHTDQVNRVKQELWQSKRELEMHHDQHRDWERLKNEWNSALAQRDLQIVELRARVDDRSSLSVGNRTQAVDRAHASTNTDMAGDSSNTSDHSNRSAIASYEMQLAELKQEVSDAYEVIDAMEAQIKELEASQRQYELRIEDLDGDVFSAQAQLHRAHLEYEEQVRELKEALKDTLDENQALVKRIDMQVSEHIATRDKSSQATQTEMPLDRILWEAREFYKQNAMLRFRSDVLRQQYLKSQELHQEHVRDLNQKMEEDVRKWEATESLIDTLKQQLIDAMSKSITKSRESEVRYQAEKRKADALVVELKQERDSRASCRCDKRRESQ
ncbi:hypothetical protein SeLEV6574_g04206 [Synchytrium endobioticum]|uniref:Uncharacterized protein n=1 Tax=Synchytrium endobioticum TaxID=286115 RepID=A0A507D0W7_9FUNG|nr:hypothetical protein SeLEV6574_g04206 [Synchytrium endobioticum]